MYLPHDLAPIVTVETPDGAVSLCRRLSMSDGSGMIVSEEIARAVIFLADEFEIAVDDLTQALSDIADEVELARSIEEDLYRIGPALT